MTRVIDVAPPGDVAESVPERPPLAWVRFVVILIGIPLLAAVFVARYGRFGFNPTDQGFVLAQSWRLLHGEIPQVDFLGPRPFGSAFLHLLDFAVPAPLMVASAFVMTVQLAIAAVALVAFLTGTSPLTWGPLRLGLVAVAALLNVTTFPAMAWHTVDGLFLTAVGWWLTDRGLRTGAWWLRWLGLFCLGFAVIVKQSFALTVPIGLLILLLHPAQRPKNLRWWGRTAVDVLWLGAAPLLYFGWITVAGGLPSAIEQLTGGQQTLAGEVWRFWRDPVGDQIHVLALLGAACVLVLAAAYAARERLGVAGRWLRAVLAAGVATTVVLVLSQGKFDFGGKWQLALLWIFGAGVMLAAVVRRGFPWQHVLVAMLGWMICLSWGYQLPTLLAGSLALGTLDVLSASLADLPRPASAKIRYQARILGALVAAVALAFTFVQLSAARDKASYADLPRPQLTADLGDVTPEMAGIRTTPSVRTYVTQIRDCMTKFPASRIAVLPDNPFVYPVFKVRNPFPSDWPLPMELTGDAETRMVDTARRLAAEGDYLVLFQTVQAETLYVGGPVPARVAPDAKPVEKSEVEPKIRKALTGQRVSCGSFTGVWAPRR